MSATNTRQCVNARLRNPLPVRPRPCLKGNSVSEATFVHRSGSAKYLLKDCLPDPSPLPPSLPSSPSLLPVSPSPPLLSPPPATHLPTHTPERVLRAPALPSVSVMFSETDPNVSSSEHNVWNSLLELFAHFGVAPHLVQCSDDRSGFMVVTTCHLALDVLLMMQEDSPHCEGRWAFGFRPVSYWSRSSFDELPVAPRRSHSV